ncbi:MAG: right-handed parallel beta-helix repeat-containing protein [Vicinamibacterales bacterium]
MYLGAKRFINGWAAAAGCALVLTVTAAAGTTSDLCGTTVLADLTLDHDLTCPGTALVVGADGVRIDLAGHTIAGSGPGAGVLIVGRNGVWVSGGRIEGFVAGVQVNNSTGVVVKHMTFTANGEGVDLQTGSRGATIKESSFFDHRARGVMMRAGSVDNTVKENTFTGNNLGVALNGTVDATVKENVMTANRAAGIRVNVPATGNLVAENTLDGSPAGIDFPVTAGWAVGNTFKENRISNNVCGVKGPTAGNTFLENTFTLNGADVCP